jgi:hypothetical protein
MRKNHSFFYLFLLYRINRIFLPIYGKLPTNNALDKKCLIRLRGTGSRDRIQILWQNWIFLDRNEYLQWFLNSQDEPLISCRKLPFPRSKGENILKKLYLLERYLQKFRKFLCAPRFRFAHCKNSWFILANARVGFVPGEPPALLL